MTAASNSFRTRLLMAATRIPLIVVMLGSAVRDANARHFPASVDRLGFRSIAEAGLPIGHLSGRPGKTFRALSPVHTRDFAVNRMNAQAPPEESDEDDREDPAENTDRGSRIADDLISTATESAFVPWTCPPTLQGQTTFDIPILLDDESTLHRISCPSLGPEHKIFRGGSLLCTAGGTLDLIPLDGDVAGDASPIGTKSSLTEFILVGDDGSVFIQSDRGEFLEVALIATLGTSAQFAGVVFPALGASPSAPEDFRHCRYLRCSHGE